MIKPKLLTALLIIINFPAKSQPALADSTIKKTSLEQTVYFLSHDSLKGRFTGADGATAAAEFIAAEFDSIGLSPIYNDNGYYNNFSTDYNGKKLKGINVIGALPPKVNNDTIVIISAHYDHIGQGDDFSYNTNYSKKDNIYNGANDNATGVAAMLELAKYYTAKNDNRYLILFVAFSGEELGLTGSEHLAQQLKPALIKAVINLEMLGRPVTKACFITAANETKIVKNFNRYLKRNNPQLKNKFFKNDPYNDERLFERSDHYPFTERIENAFTIMGSSPKDQYYHTIDDEYNTIDFDFLHLAVKNIAVACEYFIL